MSSHTSESLSSESLPPISGFVVPGGRTFVSPTVGNLGKATIWGSVVAISQSAASSYAEQYAATQAAGKAINISALKSSFVSKLGVFWPSIVGHTAVFALYRASLESTPGRTNTGVLAGVQPLVLVALPSVAWAAQYRALPPAYLRFGLLSAALLHGYDRCYHPKGLHVEGMPTAGAHRRVW